MCVFYMLLRLALKCSLQFLDKLFDTDGDPDSKVLPHERQVLILLVLKDSSHKMNQLFGFDRDCLVML